MNNERISIREICREDDAAIAEIVRENLKNHRLDIPGTAYYDPQLDCLSRYYSEVSDARIYFVAENESGELVGGVGMEPLAWRKGSGELQKLYVSAKLQRRGIGQALLERIEVYAKSIGLKCLYLETHSNLKAALNLYEKNGYHRIERPAEVIHSAMDLFYIKEL